MDLNKSEMELIRNSWQEYNKGDLVDQGVHMFMRIFQSRPDLKHIWKFSEDDDSAEKYKKNPKLRYHIKRLFATLGIVVDGLEYPEELVETLEDLGRRHNKYNVKKAYFEPVGDGLLFAISRPLGNKFTPETREAWTKLYTWLSVIMLRQMTA